ncbi:MAG: DegV family protein [Coriobacteriales bacterium]
MAQFVLSCESTADLSQEVMDEFDIKYVCFHFYLDGVEHPDDLGQSVPFDEFYRRMAEGADTRTAGISVGEYENHFRPFLEEGRDILHVSLSTGLSGTYNAARDAAARLSKEFPDRKIYVVDSLGASSGYGLIMVTLSELRAKGMDVDEAHDWVEEHKLEMRHEFFSTDLTYYVRGGRVKPVTGFVGNLLNICPLLDMEDGGHLIPREKVRTKKRVIKRIVEKMQEHAQNGLEYAGRVFISESACMEDARAVADLVEEKFAKMTGKVQIFSVGTTIGSHTGPGTVALFFWGSKRGK